MIYSVLASLLLSASYAVWVIFRMDRPPLAVVLVSAFPSARRAIVLAAAAAVLAVLAVD